MRQRRASGPSGRGSLRKRRKSTITFLMTLPLFTLILVLVAYPTLRDLALDARPEHD